jgi:hypothetical protein
MDRKQQAIIIFHCLGVVGVVVSCGLILATFLQIAMFGYAHIVEGNKPLLVVEVVLALYSFSYSLYIAYRVLKKS